MQIIRFAKIPFQPASHEDPSAPGVLKKVLLTKDQLQLGQVQMINWAQLPPKSSFRRHYHEDMQEIFILVQGRVSMRVEGEEVEMSAGDAVVVPPMSKHEMTNLLDVPADYVVLGISSGQGGRTIVAI